MTRAPFVMGKAPEGIARSTEIYDTTIGWRFINPVMKAPIRRRRDPETARMSPRVSGVARRSGRLRIRSQQRAGAAIASGYFAENHPVSVPGGRRTLSVDKDEHRAGNTLEDCQNEPIVRNPDGDAGMHPASMTVRRR